MCLFAIKSVGNMKGSYCLIINIKKDTDIKIGKKLGFINFKKGCYVYVGSAMNSLNPELKDICQTIRKSTGMLITFY